MLPAATRISSIIVHTFMLAVLLRLAYSVDARRPRIVGGRDASPNEFPYVVSLTRRGTHFCGAILLHPRWILTAAHCMCSGVGRVMHPAQIRAVLGQQRLSNGINALPDINEDTILHVADLDRVVVHPAYTCSKAAADIALLRTVDPVPLSDRVQIARMPNIDELHFGSADLKATVCGWGWTAEDVAVGDRAERLQKADVTVWPAAQCGRMYAEHGQAVEFGLGQMCAGRKEGGVDACWADSGGPLIGGRDGRTVIGVVSTGIGCGRVGLPGIYTVVAEYLGWMDEVMMEETGL